MRKFSYGLVVALVLTLVLSSSLVVEAGIFGSDDNSNSGQSVLQEIQSEGKITIAVNAGAPPFSFRNDDGELTGMCIEIDRLLAEKMGVEVEFVDMEWAGLIPSLLSGRVDMVGDRMSNTLERAKSVAFTDSYFQTGTVVYADEGTSYTNAQQIKGKGLKVGVMIGSIQEEVARDQLNDSDIVPLNSNADIKEALLSGRIDVALEDEVIASSLISKDPEKLEMLSGYLVTDTYSYTVRPENDHLRLWINLFFERIKRSGEFAEIYEKWLNKEWEPTPQKRL